VTAPCSLISSILSGTEAVLTCFAGEWSKEIPHLSILAALILFLFSDESQDDRSSSFLQSIQLSVPQLCMASPDVSLYNVLFISFNLFWSHYYPQHFMPFCKAAFTVCLTFSLYPPLGCTTELGSSLLDRKKFIYYRQLSESLHTLSLGDFALVTENRIVNALTLLVGWQEGYLACRKSSFNNFHIRGSNLTRNNSPKWRLLNKNQM